MNFYRYDNFDNYNMFYTLEEEIILDKIDLNGGILSKIDLNDNEIEECKKMVSRGLLNRIRDNNKTYYMKNYTGEEK